VPHAPPGRLFEGVLAFNLRVNLPARVNLPGDHFCTIRVVLTPRNGWMRSGSAVDAQRMHSGSEALHCCG